MPRPLKDKLRNSLRASFMDGVFAAVMLGMLTDFITPFALALKASVTEIGMLSSIPSLFASIFQFKVPDLAERPGGRLRTVKTFVFLQASSLVPLALIPFVPWGSKVPLLIACVTLFTGFGAFAGAAWSSLIAEYLPPRKRGKYFGWRNQALGVITLASAFLASFVLNKLAGVDLMYGFTVIFGVAAACRFASWYYITKMYDAPMKSKPSDYFSFLDFVRRFRESNYLKFVLFISSLSFSIFIAGPFFAVLMLRDYKFDYFTFVAVVSSATVMSFLMLPRWGAIADKAGNVKVMRFCSVLICALPLLWLVSGQPLYLVFVQMFSGFIWSGFNLAASNFIYDAVSPPKRVRCVAYFNIFNGTALFLGAMLGGFLADRVPPVMGYSIYTLFLISACLRVGVVGVFYNAIKEVRQVENLHSMDLFYSVTGIRPALGLFRDAFQFLTRI